MALLGIVDACFRELLLFAAAGVLIGGIDDLAVDCIYWGRLGWRRIARRGSTVPLLRDLPPVDPASRFAVFVPAWDEAGVIAPMLRLALARLDHPGCTIFVGCYPNDRATIDAVADVAEGEPRLRLVIGAADGPTTKADCLNTLWRALLREDAGRSGAGETRAVILHDAEDVVPAGELAIFDALIGRHDIVQLPVLPLIDPERPLVSGVVADEFAEMNSTLSQDAGSRPTAQPFRAGRGRRTVAAWTKNPRHRRRSAIARFRTELCSSRTSASMDPDGFEAIGMRAEIARRGLTLL